jgi:hypothetical protein
MSQIPSSTPAPDLDQAQIEAITKYLGLTQETRERLQVLREQVTETLNDEFSVVATDLAQLRGILGDAAEKLSGTFRVMNASADELRRTLGQARETPELAVLARLGEIAGEMASTTGTTVQSLQFDDMAAQLLQHVNRKLDVIARLSKDMTVINPTSASVPPFLRSDQLDELFATLERYRTELTVSTRKVVQQQSLESGDIELF